MSLAMLADAFWLSARICATTRVIISSVWASLSGLDVLRLAELVEAMRFCCCCCACCCCWCAAC